MFIRWVRGNESARVQYLIRVAGVVQAQVIRGSFIVMARVTRRRYLVINWLQSDWCGVEGREWGLSGDERFMILEGFWGLALRYVHT